MVTKAVQYDIAQRICIQTYNSDVNSVAKRKIHERFRAGVDLIDDLIYMMMTNGIKRPKQILMA